MSTDTEQIVFAGSGHENPSLMMWSGIEGYAKLRIISKFSYDYSIYALAVSPSGTRIAAGTKPGLLRVYSLVDIHTSENHPVLFDVFHQAGIVSLAFCTDDILASGGLDGRIKLWSISEKSQLAEIQAHTGGVFALCQMGSLVLASIGGDNVLRVWDMDTLKAGYESSSFTLPKIRGLTCLDYSFANGILVHPTGNGDLHIYDSYSDFAKRIVHVHKGSFCALACGSKYVATAGQDDAIIRLWSFSMDEPIAEVSAPLGVIAVCWMGINTLMTVYNNGSGQIWNVDGKLLPGPRIGSLDLRCTIGRPVNLISMSRQKNNRQWRDNKILQAKEIISDPANHRQIVGITNELCHRGFSVEAALITADAAKAQNRPLRELEARLALAEGLGNSKITLPSLYALAKLLRRLKEPVLAKQYLETILQIDESYLDVNTQISSLQSDPFMHICPESGVRGDLMKEGAFLQELQKYIILDKKFTWPVIIKVGKTLFFNTHLSSNDVAESVSASTKRGISELSSIKLIEASLVMNREIKEIKWIYVPSADKEMPIAFGLEIRSNTRGSDFTPYGIFDTKLLSILETLSSGEHNQQVKAAWIKLQRSSDARNWLKNIIEASIKNVSLLAGRNLSQADDEF
ncbi:MAG: hypothetical protein GY845_30065 [Planctomycetes bacterium]|nr:hypothetical protein [Planctomycetota bacterium]